LYNEKEKRADAKRQRQKRVLAVHNRHSEHDDNHDNHDNHTIKDILMKITELLTINQSIKGQLNKAEKEIVAKIAELQTAVDALTAQLADATLTPEQEQSVTDVQAAAQALDDLNPDVVPPVV